MPPANLQAENDMRQQIEQMSQLLAQGFEEEQQIESQVNDLAQRLDEDRQRILMEEPAALRAHRHGCTHPLPLPPLGDLIKNNLILLLNSIKVNLFKN